MPPKRRFWSGSGSSLTSGALDVIRQRQSAVPADGPGTKYLIQHSAPSWRTSSSAWTAHFLSERHDAEDSKLFDAVPVVSNREGSIPSTRSIL